jgi:hypothetical protein
MSWHFLQGQEEVSWEGNSLVGAPSALLSMLPTQDGCSLPANATDYLGDSLSGMTCEPLTVGHGEEGSMSLAGAFRARTSVFPTNTEQESLGSEVGCGSTCTELLARFDLNTFSWRTAQHSLFGGLEPFSETWPVSGMMQNGMCWERTTQGRSTNESEYGFLPTPLKSDGDGGGCLRAKNGREYNLRDWWARQGLGKRRPQRRPEFWEWVMGWPMGWTGLEPVETDKFQQWLNSHGIPSNPVEASK